MKQEFLDKIRAVVSSENVWEEEPMSRHTTFRVGGKADVFVTPAISQIAAVLALAKEYEVPVTVIGNGSNLLVGDKGIRGMVIALAKPAAEWKIEGSRMSIGAGTLLSKAAQEAAKNSLSGLEFAAGIPGTVGGAIVMNAGAYGGEMKDIVTSVKVLTLDGTVKELSSEELEFSYRHSCILEKQYIVLEAVVELQPGEEAQIRTVMADLKNRRIEKQPLEYPSAGSTFQRPEGYFAGKLIEDAKLRGYSVGGAQVSEKHCGFVINKGGATAADIQKLIEDVREKVYEKFQVELKPEIKMIGEF